MKKNLLSAFLMVLAINYNLFCEIDIKKIFNNKQYESSSSVNHSESNRISPMTGIFLNEIKKVDVKSESILRTEFAKKFLLKEINNKIYISGLLRVNDGFNIQLLQNRDVKIGTKAGNILSVKIPLDKLNEICNLQGINYIQIDERVSKKLDKVRTDIHSDEVNIGTGLPRGFKGTDVIVGIVDGGFDYTHINFLREDGSEYRILRVWNQSADAGTPPEGFSYGAELSTTNAILNEQTDALFDSHGSHVAGIAAGSGYMTEGKWKGIAPDADLVFVSMGWSDKEAYNTGQSEVLDGINYIFKTAEKLGKPAVVNLSLGVHIGPHDGTSLFDEACDALVGEGKIIVGSAGNEGDVPLHLSHTFSQSSQQLHTVMYIEPVYWGDNPALGITDIWGEVGKNFNLIISLLNIQTEQRVSSDVISTATNMNSTITLTGSDNQDCNISLFVTGSDFNGKPRAFIDIETKSTDIVLLSLQANDGTVHLWNHGTGGGYPFMSFAEGMTEGNTNITVGEIGGTGKSIITVGAYTSKISYTNLNGEPIENGHELNQITPYSSLGPTADGRIKPEVTAPGSYLISSVNSFDFFMKKDSYFDIYLADESTIDGSYYWYYAGMEGTSMSSPVVVGVVALLLEAKPSLTPAGIKNILKATSRKDTYTGSIPPDGNNTWGYGKVDALAALNYTVTSVDEFNNDDLNITVYPNPANEYFFVAGNTDLILRKIIITDILGNTVLEDDNYSLFKPINTGFLNQNMYMVRLFTDKNIYNQKLIINK